MHDRASTHEANQQEKRGEFAPSPLHRISDNTMLRLIACTGVTERFDLSQVPEYGPYVAKTNPNTKAHFAVREERVYDRQGKPYQLEIQRDLDTVSIGIHMLTPHSQDSTRTQKTPIIKVGLRDREFDGTPYATPYKHLQTFEGKQTHEIPARSRWLGSTDWHYSSEGDTLPHGLKAVELSVISSDPSLNIKEPLTTKQRRHEGKLWVDAEQLAEFIDDPFAKLPEGNPPDAAALNNWYRHWWQVTNRILRGKSVPLPGQTSQRAFNGFLEHVTTQSAQTLRALGYDKLSAVPTWEYVREKFQRLGFTPDHKAQHEEAEKFLERLFGLELRHLTRRQERFKVGNFVNQKALISWLAVLPFAIQRHPTFSPQLDLPQEYEHGFQEVFSVVKHAVSEEDGIHTYPLAPRKNLWYSLQLT